MKYQGIHYRSVVELKIANRIRWEEEDVKAGKTSVNYTPVNIGIADMCAGKIAKHYTLDELKNELNRWSHQADIWGPLSGEFASRVVRNCLARIDALSATIQERIREEGA